MRKTVRMRRSSDLYLRSFDGSAVFVFIVVVDFVVVRSELILFCFTLSRVMAVFPWRINAQQCNA